jgi:gamma-glutamyltranspeptidase/glutathione hydrolase
MARIAIASGTQTAADAGADAARAGGNAIDIAVAAMVATWVCEPGITALGSGGFCTVWTPQGEPIVYDGFATVPADTANLGRATRHVTLPYGGGADTVIGPGSIGTPGALAALETAWREHGRLPWRELIEPAARLARDGFSYPFVAEAYLATSGPTVYGSGDAANKMFLAPDGTMHRAGDLVRRPELAATLERIAEDGAAAIYGGSVGQRIAAWLADAGGALSLHDLETYEVVARPALQWSTDAWSLASVPAPAVGGAAFLDLVDRMQTLRPGTAPDEFCRAMVPMMRASFADRARLLASDTWRSSGEPPAGVDAWIARRPAPPSTSHTAAVDAGGLACSISTSTGYGSGVVVPGTGVMLNNMLGELELLPGGRLPPGGARLPSNMAPSIGRSADGCMIALGAGGSDRIPSALAQVWWHRTIDGERLEHAVVHPRCHLETWEDAETLAHEDVLDVTRVEIATRSFPGLHMYFGGVQAAEGGPGHPLAAAADPRRASGGCVL